MGLHDEADRKRYLSVLADGKFHETVDEDTEGAKLRIVEQDDGDDIEKWELTYPGITAVVKSIKFNEGDYGTNINIAMEDDEENQYVVSLSCSNTYGERFMEALPNLDLNKELTLKPFSFKPKGAEHKVRGINIFQDEEQEDKIFSAFSTKEDDKWKVLIKGYPMPDAKKKYNPEKWKTFFATRREWVMDYLLENDLVLAADEETTVDEKPAKKNKKEGDDDDF